ncbi:MAG: His-Xaa-Ser system protein HxsD [Nanoarchaeota archaeon]
MDGINVFEDGACKRLDIKTSIYPLKVVVTTAYTFLDRAFILLDGDPKSTIIVHLQAKKEGDAANLLVKEFQNALLGYAHFQLVSDENRKIREMIVYRALMTMEHEVTHAK